MKVSDKNTPLQTNFGKAVRDARDEQGYSQEVFADEAGLDRTYISGVERGVRNISLLNIAKIAKALHIKISDLFKRAGL